MKDFDGQKRRPKIAELEALVAVADTGSFGAAAAELNCTQSRISHAIAELEYVVGCQLMERSRTGTTPTEIGLKTIVKAKEILAIADSIGSPKIQLLKGTVRLATYQSVATHILPTILDDLAHRYSDIQIEVNDGCVEREEVERHVRDGSADLGIAHLPVGFGLSVRRFAEDDYVVVVNAGRTASKQFFWKDLEQCDFIALRCSGAEAILERCRVNGMTAKPAMSFSSVSTILAHIRNGRGFSILPRLSIEPLPEGLAVVPLPMNSERTLAIIAVRSKPSEVVRAVLEAFIRSKKRISITAGAWVRFL
jgi:DNA-binding transcriptional LysR family regulator